MLVETATKRLLIDPWLIGSCYWRSWWHFPKPVEVNPNLFDVDAIYITHGHFDHLHYPSLRRFDRSLKILVPRFLTSRMLQGIESLGFKNIVEMPHGTPYSLDGKMTLYSYQHGFDDSAVVIEAGGTTILNLNDSHVTGLALRQILKRHGRIDFLFRSHAPAQGYPICYEAEDPAELQFHSREDYIVRFHNSIRIVQPKYAVPFASNICHLHQETAALNRYNITPREVAAHCEEVFGRTSPVVLMVPGDSWDSETGFHLAHENPYMDASRAIASLAEQARPILERYYAEEDSAVPVFEPFRAYMMRFMRNLPRGIGLLFRPIIVFDQPAATNRYWIVDFRKQTVTASSELPPDANSVIRVHPAVLMDAVDKDILFFVHISKRLKIRVRQGGMKDEFKFWGLLQLYETGYLPLRNVFTLRAVCVLWRRRYEVFETFRATLRPGRFEKKAVPEVY